MDFKRQKGNEHQAKLCAGRRQSAHHFSIAPSPGYEETCNVYEHLFSSQPNATGYFPRNPHRIGRGNHGRTSSGRLGNRTSSGHLGNRTRQTEEFIQSPVISYDRREEICHLVTLDGPQRHAVIDGCQITMIQRKQAG
jgi:hypothetical protein